MSQENGQWMFLSADEVSIIEKFRTQEVLRQRYSNYASQRSAINVTKSTRDYNLGLSSYLQEENTSESEASMPIPTETLREILQNASRLEQKTERLAQLTADNSDAAEKIIRKLIQTHPNREALEQVFGP